MYSPIVMWYPIQMTKKTQAKPNSKKAVSFKKLEKEVAALALAKRPKSASSKGTPFADVGSKIGSTIAGVTGFKNATGIGKWLGQGIGSIFGSGDYRMVGTTPDYNVLSSNQIPQFRGTAASNIVCHREYIGDITGTAGFSNNVYPLNPGISTTFPWLSSVAENYQEYKFHGLIFEFRPLITDFVTSGAPGVVVMATNYNADQAAYVSKQAMENSEFAVSVKPTNQLIHAVECATNVNVLPQAYVRTGSVPTTQDLRLYDLGNFQFATQQNPVQDLGELWVSYCVEFFKPILPGDFGGVILSGHAYTTTCVNATPLGTLSFNVGTLPLTVAGTKLTWTGQPGQYYYGCINWVGGSAVALTYPTFSFTGCNFVNFWANRTAGANFSPIAGITSGVASINFLVSCTAFNSGPISITLGTGGTIPTNSQCDIMITEYDVTSV